MKTHDLDARLKRISERMETFPVEGTTKIDPNCLTDRELRLIQKVDEIQEKYAPNLPPVDVMFENWKLFSKVAQIIIERTYDLFVTVMSKAFYGDEIEEHYFKVHFFNFMKDWIECMENVQKWTLEERDEWKRDMKETGLINSIPRIRNWTEEEKRKMAT